MGPLLSIMWTNRGLLCLAVCALAVASALQFDTDAVVPEAQLVTRNEVLGPEAELKDEKAHPDPDVVASALQFDTDARAGGAARHPE